MHRDEREKGWRNGGLTEVLIRSRRWIVPIVEKIKEAPTKRGPGISLVRTLPSIVCAHTLNVLSSWSGAKSAGPAKRAGWLADWIDGGSESAAKDCRCVPLTFDECSSSLAVVASSTRKRNRRVYLSVCSSRREQQSKFSIQLFRCGRPDNADEARSNSTVNAALGFVWNTEIVFGVNAKWKLERER